MDRTNHASLAGTERPGHVTVDESICEDSAGNGSTGPDDGIESDGNGRSERIALDTPAGTGADGIEIEEVDGWFRRSWNEVVDQSRQATPFHRFEFLETIERHTAAELHALVGRVDDEPVGVFPLFGWHPAGPFDVVFSPPPRMGLYVLGPAMVESGHPAAVERRNRQFLHRCLDWVDTELGPTYLHVETSYRYADVRPFAWRGHDVTPLFTYLVDLERDEDDLFMAFSSDARSNVRQCREADVDCEVRVAGTNGLRRIVARVNERYAEQGRSSPLDPAFVTDLYQALPDGEVRPYVTTVDGEFAGGMIALEHDDTIYRWQGGPVPDVELPVNDFLDWQIMQDAMDRDLRYYDLVGANTERLCEYKAKFDPELACYYALDGGNRVVRSGVELFGELTTRLRER